MTTYGHLGKLRCILSATLIIQWPYMAIQENFVTCLLWRRQSNDQIYYMIDLGCYRKLLCRTRSCKVWCLFSAIYTMIEQNSCYNSKLSICVTNTNYSFHIKVTELLNHDIMPLALETRIHTHTHARTHARTHAYTNNMQF